MKPLIVKWPGKIQAGTLSEATVSSVDFYPTLLELAEADKPEEQVLDGKSLYRMSLILNVRFSGITRFIITMYQLQQSEKVTGS